MGGCKKPTGSVGLPSAFSGDAEVVTAVFSRASNVACSPLTPFPLCTPPRLRLDLLTSPFLRKEDVKPNQETFMSLVDLACMSDGLTEVRVCVCVREMYLSLFFFVVRGCAWRVAPHVFPA